MLNIASRQAMTSDFPTFKHGAVLAKGSTILNLGVNKNQFNSFAARFKSVPKHHATLHAELCCVLGVERESTLGATVYVARVNRRGAWKMSKPCCMCEAAMKYIGIKKVIYTVDEHHIGEIRL
tara:strand:+ start:237 stop:605 length:369 start_codon:yes stop_codon:yes gene_type:complete